MDYTSWVNGTWNFYDINRIWDRYMDRKEILRRNLDRVIWDIEKARVSVSEHHIVKIVAVVNIR